MNGLKKKKETKPNQTKQEKGKYDNRYVQLVVRNTKWSTLISLKNLYLKLKLKRKFVTNATDADGVHE